MWHNFNLDTKSCCVVIAARPICGIIAIHVSIVKLLSWLIYRITFVINWVTLTMKFSTNFSLEYSKYQDFVNYWSWIYWEWSRLPVMNLRKFSQGFWREMSKLRGKPFLVILNQSCILHRVRDDAGKFLISFRDWIFESLWFCCVLFIIFCF